MENNTFFKLQLCERIKIEPSFLHKNFRDEVLRRLKLKVEGICSKHGYIQPDSIEIIKICAGRVELIGLNGNTQFDVIFSAQVCNPLLGSVLRCKVVNINKFGILAEAGGIIEAIIAKNSVSIQSEIDLSKVHIGDDILVEVVGKKYELNDKKISIIGKIIKDTASVEKIVFGGTNTKKNVFENEDEEFDNDEIRSLEAGAISDDGSNEEEDEIQNDEEEVQSEVGIEDSDSEIKEGGNFFSDDDDYFNSEEEDYNEIEEDEEVELSEDE